MIETKDRINVLAKQELRLECNSLPFGLLLKSLREELNRVNNNTQPESMIVVITGNSIMPKFNKSKSIL